MRLRSSPNIIILIQQEALRLVYLRHSGHNLKGVRLIGHVISVPLVYGLSTLLCGYFICVFRDFENLPYLNFILHIINIGYIYLQI
jgi:hypothetical protein